MNTSTTDQTVSTFRRHLYEPDSQFNADGYKVSGFNGVAFSVLGWELREDEDTEWTGIYERTGDLLVIMKGDDKVWHIEPSDLTPITSDEYCPGCGQIGCKAYAS